MRKESRLSMDEIRIENLLADALKPVDPPQRMSDRLHDTFSAITDAAASDLLGLGRRLTESELSRCVIPATGSVR